MLVVVEAVAVRRGGRGKRSGGRERRVLRRRLSLVYILRLRSTEILNTLSLTVDMRDFTAYDVAAFFY